MGWMQAMGYSMLLALALPLHVYAQHAERPSGESQPRPSAGNMSRPSFPSSNSRASAPFTNRQQNGQHLPQWFAQHQSQPLNQQENALRHEQGFSRLPQGQQQQLVDRLHRLNMAPPVQRQRMMERNERFEALPPQRQQEIRGASETLGQMPPDRRQAVRQAFRDLRSLPLEDRQSALGSARFQAEYSPQERTVLNNMLSIEPYQPQ